jgi:uncharacterized protein
LLLEPTKWALAYAIDRLLGLEYERGPPLLVNTFTVELAYMVPVAVVFTLPNALGEELGWRGFALPRLQAKYGPIVSSLVLGLFWEFWHIPAWMAWQEGDTYWWLLFLMVVNTVPTTILFTWIYNRSRGSLLQVCLYHASITNTGYFLPKIPSSTETVLLRIFALILVIKGWLSTSRDESLKKAIRG